MELVNKNLRFLRGKANLTQKELALRLDVKLPVIGSYEEGRSLPPIPTSIKIAQLFNVSLDMLLTRDVSESRHKTKAGKEKEILAITIDSLGDENVEFVSHKASAGYISEYSDTEYLKELPKISLPTSDSLSIKSMNCPTFSFTAGLDDFKIVDLEYE